MMSGSLRRLLMVLAVLVSLWAAPVLAVEEALPDPALEARAQGLAREIRCVVCENEPVALSQSEIAVDMRQAIRERVSAGDSDNEVRAFFAARYGEFVLLRPRFSGATLALWLTPLVLLLLAGAALVLRARGRQEADGVLAGGPVQDAETAKARDALARHRQDSRQDI